MQLREWLERERITQDQLGARMCPPVSQGKVSHWLNGTRRVSLGEAIQINTMTGGDVSFADLWSMYRRAAAESSAEAA